MIKASEIYTSMLFNFDFAIFLNFITAVIEQIFNAFATRNSPIGIPTKEAKAETETHPVIAEVEIRKFSI